MNPPKLVGLALISLTLCLSPFIANASTTKPMQDPYLWLEEVNGDKALKWARERNKISQTELEAKPEFKETKERILKILNSKDKIPYITKYGDLYYNFWKDDEHKHGLWRRTTLEEYKKENPAWETVLDLDKLSKEERKTGFGKEKASSIQTTTWHLSISLLAAATPR